MIEPGLNKLPKDKRDYRLGAIVELPKLEDLPDEFYLPGINDYTENQGPSDFCTGAGSTFASYLQEGVRLSMEWVFAVGKWLAGGDVDSFGLDLRTVMKVHQKYGAIEKKDAPFSLENKDASFLRRIENWPKDLFNKAIEHRKANYVQVDGPYDVYDNIRATIYKYRNEKRAVVLGIDWRWSVWDIVLKLITGKGTGHCMAAGGWNKYGMFTKNSYGAHVGKNGGHYITREVINRDVPKYGAFMFIDLTPEELEKIRKETKIKSLYEQIITLYQKILDILTLKKK